jgi:hypothetical protein
MTVCNMHQSIGNIQRYTCAWAHRLLLQVLHSSDRPVRRDEREERPLLIYVEYL